MKIIGSKKKYLTTYINDTPLKVGSKLNIQSFNQAYFRSNVIVCRKDIIKKYNSLTSNKIGYVITKNNLDIDTIDDFNFASFLIKKY